MAVGIECDVRRAKMSCTSRSADLGEPASQSHPQVRAKATEPPESYPPVFPHSRVPAKAHGSIPVYQGIRFGPSRHGARAFDTLKAFRSLGKL